MGLLSEIVVELGLLHACVLRGGTWLMILLRLVKAVS